MTDPALTPLLTQFADKRIAVLGDVILDRFIYGVVSRISPEAPVPIVEVSKEECYPGGAANVARNLRSLGAQVTLIGRVGTDPAAAQLRDILSQASLSPQHLVHSSACPTNMKTRVIARTQQVVRVDREKRIPLDPPTLEAVLKELAPALAQCDALIIEDYGKGFITQPLIDAVRERCAQANVPWFVDPNPRNPLDWSGATAVKPNRTEAFTTLGLPESHEPDALLQTAQQLLKKWDTRMLLLTLGEDGMLLARDGQPPHWSACTAREVYDVSGAGDTAISTFALALAAGASPVQAADLANIASGIVVGKLGTATITAEELSRALCANP